MISLNGSELLGSLTYSRSLGLIKKARSQVSENIYDKGGRGCQVTCQ